MGGTNKTRLKLKAKDEIIILNWNDIKYFNNYSLFKNENCKVNKELKIILNARKILFNFLTEMRKQIFYLIIPKILQLPSDIFRRTRPIKFCL